MAAKKQLFQVDKPLTGADLTRYKTELSRLQGNVLKSHGRDSAVSVFLTFQPGKQSAVREFLRTFARAITSAATQQAQTKRHKQKKVVNPSCLRLCASPQKATLI